MSTQFQQALDEGYSQEEIMNFLSKSPQYGGKIQMARDQGYGDDEISTFLSRASLPTGEEERVTAHEDFSIPRKVGSAISKGFNKAERLATQGAIGAIQRATLPYDMSAILSQKVGSAISPQLLRQNIFKEIENLQTMKSLGKSEAGDDERIEFYTDLIKNPEKMKEFIFEKTPSFDVGSLIEEGSKIFGVDLSPQGVGEMALRWIGFIKNPEKAKNLFANPKSLNNYKEAAKALLPTGKEAARGIGAASALSLAAEAEFGPLGTIAVLLIGDATPNLIAKPLVGVIRGGAKKNAARLVAKFTPADKLEVQKSIIQDFRGAGLQADAGTITGNKIIQSMQTAIDQSGLTGTALEDFKKTLSSDVKTQYKKIASELGEVQHESKFDAGLAIQEAATKARNIDSAEYRNLYNLSKKHAGNEQVYAGNVGSLIRELKKELLPGKFKSEEQKKVLSILSDLKRDVFTPKGDIKSASINSLINNKIALQNVIDYEVQGGAKQLLKLLVKELDNAITTGSKNPEFVKLWKKANKKFGEHARLFRGKVISDVLKNQSPEAIFNRMNTVSGTNKIRSALNKTTEGRKLFKQLSAFKLEEIIGKNLVNSVTEQANFGTFANVLKKGQNRAIIKNLLGEESFETLEKLQKASGRIAENNQKFFNTSRSGSNLIDIGFAVEIVRDIGALFLGNPWPIARNAGTIFALRRASKLITNKEFLVNLEDVILESEGGNTTSYQAALKDLSKNAQDILSK